MSETMHLDARDVPTAWIPRGYKGRKFKAVICERVTVSDADLRWDSGSRSEYVAIGPSGQRALACVKAWPNYGEQVVELKPGLILRKHTISSGKDIGLTFYCVASDVNATRLAAPVADLDATDRAVLDATRSYKASYGGRTRREMVNDDREMRARVRGEALDPISKAQWDSAVAKLQGLGLLDARGAMTNKGRNVS